MECHIHYWLIIPRKTIKQLNAGLTSDQSLGGIAVFYDKDLPWCKDKHLLGWSTKMPVQACSSDSCVRSIGTTPLTDEGSSYSVSFPLIPLDPDGICGSKEPLGIQESPRPHKKINLLVSVFCWFKSNKSRVSDFFKDSWVPCYSHSIAVSKHF